MTAAAACPAVPPPERSDPRAADRTRSRARRSGCPTWWVWLGWAAMRTTQGLYHNDNIGWADAIPEQLGPLSSNKNFQTGKQDSDENPCRGQIHSKAGHGDSGLVSDKARKPKEPKKALPRWSDASGERQHSDLSGGALSTRPQRTRTQRLLIHYEQEQHHIFVPQEWTCGMLAEKIPLHFGIHPGWVDILWNTQTSITITPNHNFPVLDKVERQQLLKLCEGLVPTATDRKEFSYKDIYLGHRASRAHGLTASTLRCQQIIRPLNERLRHLLPGATWTTLGLLQHRNVPTHQDMLSEEWSYALTLVNNGAIFR